MLEASVTLASKASQGMTVSMAVKGSKPLFRASTTHVGNTWSLRPDLSQLLDPWLNVCWGYPNRSSFPCVVVLCRSAKTPSVNYS